jgi:hypothetical protein
MQKLRRQEPTIRRLLLRLLRSTAEYAAAHIQGRLPSMQCDSSVSLTGKCAGRRCTTPTPLRESAKPPSAPRRNRWALGPSPSLLLHRVSVHQVLVRAARTTSTSGTSTTALHGPSSVVAAASGVYIADTDNRVLFFSAAD